MGTTSTFTSLEPGVSSLQSRVWSRKTSDFAVEGHLLRRLVVMNRIELEARLSRERASLLESYAALSAEDVNQGLTASRHEGSAHWSAKDHLAHLAGIEHIFNGIIRRHLAGDPEPIRLPKGPDGNLLPRDQILPHVHAMNEVWVNEHRDKTFSEVVALGQKIRSQTLALIAELTDEQLQEKVTRAPWADGSIGGILSVNADHGRNHFKQVTEALASNK